MPISRLKSVRLGMSLLEVTIATLLMSLVMVAAMQSSAMKTRHGAIHSEQAIGSLLANDLLAEVMRREYGDTITPLTFGRDLDELTAYKSSFDDVDDYDNWSESPPRHENGDYYPYGNDWARSIDVDFVNPADLTQSTLSDLGLKRVRVSVTRGGKVVTELTAIAAEASQ